MSSVVPLPTGTALYYPFIHVRNPDCVKSALIYWDRVRRIVPNAVKFGDYAMDDSDDARLLTDRGMLIATDPTPYEEKAAETFFDHIQSHSSRFQIDLETARDLANQQSGIHIEKLGNDVFHRLQEMGLAYKFGDWVSMRQEIGAFYMFCLASEMSRRMDASMFAASSNDASMGQSMLFEPEATSSVSEVLIRVGINLPSPEALRAIPTEEIVAFAERRATERQRFREVIEDLINNVRSATDQNAIDDYLGSQAKVITEAVKNLRKSLDEIHVGAVSGAAKITVPAAATLAIAALPFSVEAAAVLSVIGIAISTIACYAETRGKLRTARISSPYHYLISMANELDFDPTAKSVNN